MKKIIYITSIILLLGASSCSNDNFLDREPEFVFVEGNVLSTPAQVTIAINGVYSTLIQDRTSGLSWEHYVDKASQSGFVNWEVADFEMNFSASNQESRSIEGRWTELYRVVNAASFVIDGMMAIEDQYDNAAEFNSQLAELKFFRAWAHLNVFWGYGHWFSDDDSNPYGILYREQLASVDNLQQARLNVGESYQRIIEELDFAIEHLDNSLASGTGGFNNRFLSKEFAKVIKAKLLLRRGGMNDNLAQLNESLALVNDVLNSPPSGFAMQGDLAQMYEDSWDSEENLFSGYLEEDGFAISVVPYGSFLATQFGQEIDPDNPTPANELDAGLNFGASDFRADPRWPIVTGESYDGRGNEIVYTWTKVTRFSEYAGRFFEDDLKNNTYYFRFPELYIMRAELLARTGASIADAIAPINTMRSIRTNPILPSLTPTTQQELMDAIFFEHFFETFLENGNVFYASLRFDTSNGRPWIETTKDGQALDMNQIPYNIPSSEIFGNRLMIQNIDQE